MPEQPHPQDIARRSFDVVRRGFDQNAVRGFLHEVSSLVDRLQRAERELLERAERAEARAEMIQHPDEGAMLELLGEETTRVLTSARAAATDIRAKAESAAERLIADATAEAAGLRNAASTEADELRQGAQGESDRLLEEARTELERRRAEAEEAVAHLREEGEASAEALRAEGRRALEEAQEEAAAAVEAAKAEGKAMVAEAQAVRERMLRDLAVRRKKARLQVEKLNAGRERLLQAYEVVRRTVDEATDELNGALLDARLAADAAARRVEEEPEQTLEQLDAEVASAGLADLPLAEVDVGHDDDEAAPGPFSGEVPAVEEAPSGEAAPEGGASGATGPDAPSAASEPPEEPTEQASAAPEGGPGGGRTVTAITSERRSRRSRRKKGFEGIPAGNLTKLDPPGEEEGVRILAEEGSPPTVEAEPDEAVSEEATGTGAAEASAADDVFARLRAETGEPAPVANGSDAAAVAEEEAAPAGEVDEASDALEKEASPEGDEPAAADSPEASDGPSEVVAESDAEPEDPEAAPFQARDEALAPVDKELARRLKRALADEQNEVLDLLRREKPKGVDDLLPALDAHEGKWSEAVAEPLADAAKAGASWAGGRARPVGDLAAELAHGMVAPLRDRIDRSFAASDGNLDDVADRVRALYREWKGQRLADTAQHYAVAAYARGAFDALRKGTTVRWVVDPSTPPCPDCDDNVLAGGITKGDEFPTGSESAPAHPGCRCLVLKT